MPNTREREKIATMTTPQTNSSIEQSNIQPKLRVINFNFYYGTHKVLNDVSFDARPNFVTSIIGPSGCGKSTLLRCMNRMNDLVVNSRPEGTILIEQQDIYDKAVDVVELRKKVGMVFQKPNPFPKSIFDNLAYGLKINGAKDLNFIAGKVEQSLRDAALWDEVKDRLKESALRLSGGQQQRLCVARALAIEPEIILMDEPASALDPIATAKIEELIFKLKDKYTIIIVTHNMQQAARVSDMTAFLMQGELIEYGKTSDLFTKPSKKTTEDYITGRFG